MGTVSLCCPPYTHCISVTRGVYSTRANHFFPHEKFAQMNCSEVAGPWQTCAPLTSWIFQCCHQSSFPLNVGSSTQKVFSITAWLSFVRQGTSRMMHDVFVPHVDVLFLRVISFIMEALGVVDNT